MTLVQIFTQVSDLEKSELDFGPSDLYFEIKVQL